MSKCSTDMALLLSHQTIGSVLASRTTNLSFGLRPVWTPGVGDERAVLGDVRLVTLQRVLVELRRAEVPVDARQVAEPESIRPEVRVVCACLDHRGPLSISRWTRTETQNRRLDTPLRAAEQSPEDVRRSGSKIFLASRRRTRRFVASNEGDPNFSPTSFSRAASSGGQELIPGFFGRRRIVLDRNPQVNKMTSKKLGNAKDQRA